MRRRWTRCRAYSPSFWDPKPAGASWKPASAWCRPACNRPCRPKKAARADGAAANSAAAPARTAELQAALDILSGELKQVSTERSEAVQQAQDATRLAEAVTLERDQIIARNDEILSQVEDAVTVSVKPLDDMFRSVGRTPTISCAPSAAAIPVRGGPLNPIGYSSSGNAEISERDAKAKESWVTLDQMNTYRIAVSKMPLAMPIKSAFRLPRPMARAGAARMRGSTWLAPSGTPILPPATAW